MDRDADARKEMAGPNARAAKRQVHLCDAPESETHEALMRMSHQQKQLILHAFSHVEREAGREQLSPATQELVDRARDIIKGQTKAQRQAWRGGEQLSIQFPKRRPPTIKRRGRKRYARYPFAMVLDARKMRGNGYSYREISIAINREWATSVSWITIRDWTVQAYRLTG